MDQGVGHLWLWSPVPPTLSEKVHNRPRNNSGTVWMLDEKLEKQNLENPCTAAYEQLCCLVDETLVKRKWIMEMTYLLEKYTDSRNPLNLAQTTCLRNYISATIAWNICISQNSWYHLCIHWWDSRLSFGQLEVPPMTTKFASGQLLVFSVLYRFVVSFAI